MSSGQIGISIQAAHAAAAVDQIAEAERRGIEAAWMTVSGTSPDALTVFAAAFGRTRSILLGSSILPTWPRHPVAIAQQVVALESLAPGRLRLGIGPSHEAGTVSTYGYRWRTPLTQLREYLVVLRALLHEGSVDFEGSHVTAHARLARPVATPIMASALRPRSFELCGELADGAISWVCPVSYLEQRALPAVAKGALRAGRAAPPIVAHTPICVSEDPAVVREATQGTVGRYTRIPFYQAMFREAGFGAAAEGETDSLIDTLVVHGDEDRVARRLAELLDRGMGQVLAMPLSYGTPSERSLGRAFDAVARATRLLA